MSRLNVEDLQRPNLISLFVLLEITTLLVDIIYIMTVHSYHNWAL